MEKIQTFEATTQVIIQHRLKLKRMLRAAQELPEETPGRQGCIHRLQVEILYLKLHLNTTY